MNYQELLQRIEDESLGQYGGIRANTFGGENNWCFRQNADRTIDLRYIGERGAVNVEKLGMPEEEGCEEIYQCVKAEFNLRELFAEYNKKHPTKIVEREIQVRDRYGKITTERVNQVVPVDTE